jgi:nicotinamidase-related amidase
MMTHMPPQLQPDNTLLLVVDLQDKLLPAMHEAQACIAAARKLIDAAKVLKLPILATEQYPAGLGKTTAEIATALGDAPIYEKTRFSACVEPVLQRIAELRRPNILIAGIEAHVCVQQTVLDLLRLGQLPCVCADAITSRRPLDRDIAIARMRQAGAIITTVESAIFELLGQASGDSFKQILRIVK